MTKLFGLLFLGHCVYAARRPKSRRW